VDPGPLGRRAEPVRESLVREGVRANLLAARTLCAERRRADPEAFSRKELGERPPRLDETFRKRVGDEAYAVEELVAEIGIGVPVRSPRYRGASSALALGSRCSDRTSARSSPPRPRHRRRRIIFAGSLPARPWPTTPYRKQRKEGQDTSQPSNGHARARRRFRTPSPEPPRACGRRRRSALPSATTIAPIAGGSVVIDTAASGDPEALAADLRALGAAKVTVFGRMVSARVPITAIPTLKDLSTLQLARPVYAATGQNAVSLIGSRRTAGGQAKEMTTPTPLRPMTPAEVEAAARADPDAQPLSARRSEADAALSAGHGGPTTGASVGPGAARPGSELSFGGPWP
jgi:hypothetical protein